MMLLVSDYRIFAVAGLVGCLGCSPGIGTPDIQWGDPVGNGAWITLETQRVGRARVQVEVGDDQWTTAWGDQGLKHGIRAWLPAGRSVTLTPEVEWPSGRVRRVRALQVEVPPLPDDFPVHGVITKEPDAEMLGLRVAFNIRNNGLHYGVVIDGRGRVLWVREAPEGMRILRIREGRDKQSLFYATEQTGPAMGGDIVRFDLVTQEEVYTAAEQHHHDFVELPDGDLAWLAHDIFEESLQPPFTPPVLLSGDRILRAPLGAGPGEYDTAFALREDSGIAPWPVCSHMFDSVFLDEELDWTHSNSLGFDDEQNAFRMLIRWWDSIAQVGIDGEVDWFAGGMHSDFEVGEWFDHGHASELSGDRVWVFDNGNHGDTPRRSRLVRLQIDPSSGTAEVVQEVEDPYGRFHGYLGDVLELPGGNLLALWSGSGHLTELTADGEVVWEYAMEEQIIGRIQLVDAIPGPTVP